MKQISFTTIKSLLVALSCCFLAFSAQAQDPTPMNHMNATFELDAKTGKWSATGNDPIEIDCEDGLQEYSDDGGRLWNYTEEAPGRAWVFCPDDPTQLLKMEFTEWGMGVNGDGMGAEVFRVSDSKGFVNDKGELILGEPIYSPKDEANVPNSPNGGKIAATCDNETGCITVVFIPTLHEVDGETGEGWVFKMECEKRPIEVEVRERASAQTVHLLGGLGICAFQGVFRPDEAKVTCPPAVGGDVFVALLPTLDPTPAELAAAVFLATPGQPLVFAPILQAADFDPLTGCFAYKAIYIYDADDDGSVVEEFECGFFDVQKIWVCPPALVCNTELNVALNGDCQAAITPDHLLEDPCLLDLLHYDVQLFDAHGKKIKDNIINETHIGKTVKAVVTDRFGVQVNACWTKLNIDDNISPFIFPVADDAIFCTMDNANGPGLINYRKEKIQDEFDAADNCGFELEVGPWSFMKLDCSEEPYRFGRPVVGKWTRVITARATYVGPHSAPSASTTQTVYVLQPELLLPEKALVECTGGNEDISPEGLAKIDVKYVPHFFIESFSKDLDDMYMAIDPDHSECGYTIQYEDSPRSPTDCGYKVFRTWTILNWCTHEGPITFIQIIKVDDTTAPKITDCPKDAQKGGKDNPIIIGTDQGPFTCAADIRLPNPQVLEECSPNELIFRSWATDLHGNVVDFIAPLKKGCFADFIVHQTVEDKCGNVSETCSRYVRITDDDKPVCVVDEYTVVPLDEAGSVTICATNLDSGSYDNCGVKAIKIKKMDSTDAFDKCITLSCADLGQQEVDNQHDQECPGTVNVLFRVYDNCGNFSECMVEVELQDKIAPVIKVGGDKVADCNDVKDPYSLFDEPTAEDNCSLVTITQKPDLGTFDECGRGKVTRTWEATDACGNKSTTFQSVTLRHISDFVVMFPDDIDGECVSNTYDPDADPSLRPMVSDDDCERILIRHSDKIYTGVPDACFKIVRTWEVINWCVYDPTRPIPPVDDIALAKARTFRDGGNGYMTYVQVIKVKDTVKPVVDNPGDQVKFDQTAECHGNIKIDIKANDACTGVAQLKYHWKIETLSGQLVAEGNTQFKKVEEVPYGVYKVTIWVTDGCGNVADVSYKVDLRDGKKPGLVCIGTLAAELMPIDTDGDHLVDNGMAEVWAREFVQSYTDNCPTDCDPNDPDTDCFRIDDITGSNPTSPYPAGTSEPPATAAKGLQFNCDDKGGKLIAVWARDEAGNWDYCIAFLEVQNNMGACAAGSSASIAGTIETEDHQMVENVTVGLSGGTNLPHTVTGLDGIFSFLAPRGETYTVTAEKDMNPLNGVSTLDIVLISKHILGQQELNSPYKLIAADVNKSGSITAFDLVQIRQLILAKTDKFPNNTSWRFVDRNFSFANPMNPWATAFPEVVSISTLSAEAAADFIGVKVGDVNGNAIANNLMSAEVRNAKSTLVFQANDAQISAGEEYTVEFSAKEIASVLGYQFTLNFNQDALEFVDVQSGALTDLDAENFGLTMLDEGVITTSWNALSAVSAGSEDALFSLTFRAKQDVTLSEALSLNSRYTAAEGYDNELNIMDVAIEFNSGAVLSEGFELFQNTPNPFHNSTVIGFSLPKDATATLSIFDVAGKQLKQITGDFAKGYNEVSISRDELSGAGVLYYQLNTAEFSATKKMILVK